MRAERDRRAAILTAEGIKQSAILTAEGEKQSQILRAEGSAQARILEAQGQARAIQQVFAAIHRGKPTQKLLAYQYLQVLPQIARGDSNKMWIIPSELTDALKGIGNALGGSELRPDDGDDDETWVEPPSSRDAFAETVLEDPAKALAEARGQAARPAPSRRSTLHPWAAAADRSGRAAAEAPPPPAAAPPAAPVARRPPRRTCRRRPAAGAAAGRADAPAARRHPAPSVG